MAVIIGSCGQLWTRAAVGDQKLWAAAYCNHEATSESSPSELVSWLLCCAVLCFTQLS